MAQKKGKMVLFIIIVMVFSTEALHAEEQCLKDAWKAFGQPAYKDAIKHADRCIDQFGRMAEKKQAKLERNGISNPPTGEVDAAEKHKIFSQGLLNDVATAYFIKGNSAESLYRKDKIRNSEYKGMAVEAYNSACRLKYGRTWDPKGWFWSPCEASDRLPIE